MTNTVKVKRSSVPGKTPTTINLTAGELAINTNDAKLFYSTGDAIKEVMNKDGTLPLDNGAITSTTLTTSTTGADQVLNTFLSATYRSAKYLIQISSGSAYQMLELLLIHDGTDVQVLQYGDVKTGATLATFNATLAGGTLALTTTPVNAVTVYKVLRTCINI